MMRVYQSVRWCKWLSCCAVLNCKFLVQDMDADTVDATAVTRLLRADIDNVLHTLSPRECGVLRMRYGLDDGQEKTLEEVGAEFKVCKCSGLLLPPITGTCVLLDSCD
jgi:Sigma-70, region 4